MKSRRRVRLRVFRRAGVAEQAAAALREAIYTGELTDPLPGEHQLAKDLSISRPSVRAALARLAAEGLVVIKKRHRTRLAATPRAPAKSVNPAVCVIGVWSPDLALIVDHPVLREMYALFASRGVSWSEVFDVKLIGPKPDARLKSIVAARKNVCWILCGATEPMHRWFANSRLPAFIVGTCAPNTNLPSVDMNHAAVGWHAAGTLVSHGHRRIALIVPSILFPGDITFRREFLRYVARHAKDGSILEFHEQGNIYHFRAGLARLLSAPDRPTAILSMRADHTLTILTSLQSGGLRVPRDLSVVSRDSDRLLEMAMPDLTRYKASKQKLASLAVRIAMKLIVDRQLPARPRLIMPSFVRGSTLRKL